MIAVIRIAGLVKVRGTVNDTLDRMRLRRKFTCVLIDENSADMMGMVIKTRDCIAYGKVSEEVIEKLLKARGEKIGDSKAKISDAEAKKIAKEVLAGKKLEDLGVKPFFRLHPARGGIDSKKYYPKGVLGSHGDKINELIERML